MTRSKLIGLLVALGVMLLTAVVVFGQSSDMSSVGAAGRAPDGWREGGWRNWDQETWERENDAFQNPVVPGLWSRDRLEQSKSTDRPVQADIGQEQGITDPEPVPVAAEPVPRPYRINAPVVGRLFFDTPEGPSVCSATVVTDPARPGASNLVWTAGHCVHAGRSGGWFRNIVFIPAYRDQSPQQRDPGASVSADVAPFGTWWADAARTSDQWIRLGSSSGGDGAAFDFAVLRVSRADGDSERSLEETVGAAATVGFDVPDIQQISTVGIWGYPAAAPFDGERMFTCRSRPGRLSLAPDQPGMMRVGCTMTGGSSGGGWFVEDADGRPLLISNTSIGPEAPIWLAGPQLGPEAQKVYQTVSGLPLR
ncbi:trypsin-like serine peptidase [Streptomyces sp. NPDC017943]|uniref:trypsin-like serine peptidase n=1 Tax=Streptomyces TaxID=1883 RepID=UPI0034553166